MATLYAKCSLEMDCPKEVVIWNYYDHEHVVGTHYKHYDHVKVLAEQDGWVLCQRSYKLPIVNIQSSSMGFMYLENPNLIRSYQFGKFGTRMDQDIHLEDLPGDKCRVTCEYRMNVLAVFKIFQPLYARVINKWFINTWDEDAPMRIRRWKVWKLGFKDFVGLPYVNQKKGGPENTKRPYPLELPVPKSTSISRTGYERPFKKSTEIGY